MKISLHIGPDLWATTRLQQVLDAKRRQLLRNGVHQVGFAQADTTVKKQRVEGDGATFGNATCGGVGQFVGFADNKVVKAKAGVKRGGVDLAVRRLGCGGGLGAGWGRINGGGLVLWGDREFQTADADVFGLHFMQQQIGEVLADIVAKEIGRYEQRANAVFDGANSQRVNPGGKVVLSNRL